VPDLLTILAIVCAVFALLFFGASILAMRRRRLFRLTVNFTFGLLLLALAGIFGTVSISTQGYRAYTREETAVFVRTEPVAPQRFNAHFRFSDGREVTFNLAGDELYVDAHILKWKPIAGLLGLHTAYELDRVAGRYTNLSEEQNSARTVSSLAQDKPLNMFDLRRRYAFLEPLVDTEYGSATFITADKPEQFEIRVSTTGLLIRRYE
jgi:hypothetical protein